MSSYIFTHCANHNHCKLAFQLTML